MSENEDVDVSSFQPDVSSLDTTETPHTTQTGSRSIVALLGGQPRAAPAAAKPDTAKRRRKNTDRPTGPTQGRIVLNAPGSTAWSVSVARRDEEDSASGGSGIGPGATGKAKAAARQGGGEEDELKEMKKRAKSTRGRAGVTRGRGGRKARGIDGDTFQSSQHEDTGESPAHFPRSPPPLSMLTPLAEYDADYVDDSLPAESSGISPGKKRGRPKKARTGPTQSRKSTRSASTVRNISPEYAVIRSSSPNEVTFTGQSSQTKSNGTNKHPPFSRVNTASNSSIKGASQKDPIDVEEGQKTGPRKIAFASDAKPTHAFFSRLNQDPSSRATSVTSDRTATESTRTLPPGPGAESSPFLPVNPPKMQIDVAEASQTSNKPVKSTGKIAHSFFQTNGVAIKPGQLKQGWGGGLKEGHEWLAPWPGHAWPVHEGADLDINGAGPSRPRRSFKPTPIEDDGVFWQSVLSDATADSGPSRGVINGKRTKRPDSSNRETFCERFRPRRASQVLGNVTEATYLRDWLSALSVGNQESDGPKVMRRLPKRRPKLDDWIVDDIGANGLPDWIEEWDGDEVPEPYEEPDLPLGHRPESYAPLSMRLANSILLTGPNGSGKSAAVHAAATELGWEVFEVYPGIGKRTGGNLMSLVGDVGKNHMVGKGKEKEKASASNGATGGIKSFLEFQGDEHDGAVQMGSQGEPIEVDDGHPDRPATPPPRLRNSSVHSTPFRDDQKFRQSLILIEEVDILFEEESTFWPAVVALIAESRRPVVMTCNGATFPPGVQSHC